MRPQNSIVVFGLEEFREIYNVLQTWPICIIETFLFIFAKKIDVHSFLHHSERLSYTN